MKPWALALLMLGAAAGTGAAKTDCLSCHSEMATVNDSVHASTSCTGCHSTISSFPHPDKVAPVDCASCHSDSAATLGKSVHAGSGGPSCLSCHGSPHSILPAKDPRSSTYAGEPAAHLRRLPWQCADREKGRLEGSVFPLYRLDSRIRAHPGRLAGGRQLLQLPRIAWHPQQ